ncbi:hypothetical protein KA478_05360 [Patescibacteria group bacterium]|nr:hypothetical protein [Patescibacteria group bacterium]
MNIFIIHKSIAKQYMSLQHKIRYNKKLVEYAKAGAVIFAFVFFLGVYIYYVNKASTLGYFYRQEKNKRDAADFDYNIQSFETTKIYEDLRKKTMEGNRYL